MRRLDQSDPGGVSVPLPPARTRWIEAREAAAAATLAPLGPVHSRTPPERSVPAAPSHPGAPVRYVGPSSDAGSWSAPPALPESMPAATDPFGGFPDITGDEGPDLVPEDETVILFEEAGPAHLSAPQESAPAMHPVHAPLSPWELAGEPDTPVQAETANERLARGQREWEAFGAAILASLDIDEADSLDSAMQAMAERLDLPDPAAQPGVPAEIMALADRIASFASRLGAHGYPVIAEAQSAGDRLERALGGLAATVLADER